MSHRIGVTDLRSQPVRDIPPGLCWHLSTTASDPIYSLMLDAGDDNYRVWVYLTGDRAFTTQFAKTLSLGRHVALPLGSPPWQVELPFDTTMADNPETPGALIVCNEGAFLAVKNVGDQGDYGFVYVSLEDLSFSPSLPSAAYGVFTVWRLTTSESNPQDRTILISQGEWA